MAVTVFNYISSTHRDLSVYHYRREGLNHMVADEPIDIVYTVCYVCATYATAPQPEAEAHSATMLSELVTACHASGRGWGHYLEALTDLVGFGISSGFVEDADKAHKTRCTRRRRSWRKSRSSTNSSMIRECFLFIR